MVKLLLENGANIAAKDQNGETALVNAARMGNAEITTMLLAKKPDVSDKTRALFSAAQGGPLVIEIATDTPQQSRTRAVESPYASVVELLLQNGVNIEAKSEYDGGTPLIWAAAHGATDIVKLLLKKGANVNATDNASGTALIAAACGCAVIDMPDTYDSVRLLLGKGAKIEARDKEGKTALMAAASWGRGTIVELLIRKGANVEAEDKDGNTALLLAASGSAFPTFDGVTSLVERGANIEAKNRKGETALMLAASGGGFYAVSTIKLLLKRGADPNVADQHGNTALKLALRSGHSDAARTLKRVTAKPF